MGRITIFTSDECKNCQRVRSAFAARNIPYKEINLSNHPEKKKDIKSMTNIQTVPQVFFNNRVVGGTKETLEVLERWDMELFEVKKYNNPREMYDDIIGNVHLELDPRLHLPKTTTSPPVAVKASPDKGIVSIAKTTLDLLTFMPRANMTYLGTTYKNCFVGKDGVTAIMQHYGLESREDAVIFGRQLQTKKILHHVTGDHVFDDKEYYYRLQPFQNPGCLNTLIVWTEKVTTDPFSLVSELSRLLRVAETAATDEETGKVDYVKMGRGQRFFQFEEACCEVQGIHLGSMKESERVGFVINLYNLMVKHAFVKVGIPPANNPRSRGTFFATVAYDVGGDMLTLNELEHGVLRGNVKGGVSLKQPFSKTDKRRRLCCTSPDPRALLALDCGAKSSSPVVHKLSSERLSDELQSIAEDFCDDERNVQVDERKHELRLSQVFTWYLKDFAKSKDRLPYTVVGYLRGEKKATLQRMIDSGRTVYVPVKFIEFDWSTNSSRSKTFESSSGKLTAMESIASHILS